MMLLTTQKKNEVLASVREQLIKRRVEIMAVNASDLELWQGDDQAMYDRLLVNDKKIKGMIKAIDDIIRDTDPVGQEIYRYKHPNGMDVINRTAPFGTVLIIYESRPDVTIEAAMVAFKSNNKILLKGGSEAIHSNRILVECWHQALSDHDLDTDWVTLLELSRTETQAFLKQPDRPLDLIVPRGGEGLISFVKMHATCPVLISGRGNNFLYVHKDADWEIALPIILNAKTQKISACNALDKVLIHKDLPNIEDRLTTLIESLKVAGVEVLASDRVTTSTSAIDVSTELADEWAKEYLAMKLAIDLVRDQDAAISLINTYSGGHSASIITADNQIAQNFMNEVDAAAVYHNASTRFTDGGEFGLGAELAISTDKLHHRGPLGLHQLVTNKWFVYGTGQTR